MRGIDQLLRDKSIIRLDIGCGDNKQGPDWVGIDYRKLDGVDIVHDLETFPWPIPDNSVQVAVTSHVVEHINPAKGIFIDFMNEVWRILKPDGEFAIATPYAGSHGYFQDPSHVNPCNETTWKYFDPLDEPTGGQLYHIYEPAPWKIKFATLKKEGNMEVALVKRRDDISYHKDGKIHWK